MSRQGTAYVPKPGEQNPRARRFTYRTWAGRDAEVYAATASFEPAHVVFRTAGGSIVLAEDNANVSRLTEHAPDTAGYPATRRHTPGADR
jgi:hypothetical protein